MNRDTKTYQDRMFCSAQCGETRCDKNMTPEVRLEMSQQELPIWCADMSEGCPVYEPLGAINLAASLIAGANRIEKPTKEES